MPPDRPDTGPAAPLAAEADAFELWLRRGLQARYAALVAEPLPPALLRLAGGEAEDRFDQRVRERAYFFWLAEGRPEGRALQHWMTAFVQQIMQEASGQAGPTARDPQRPIAGERSRPRRRFDPG